MTGTYDWNPMPHAVEIRRPECGNGAVFEFAEVVRVALKKDVEFFKRNKLFEYELLRDSAGSGWHSAFYFPRLAGSSTDTLRELPAGYSPSDWNHSDYLYRSLRADWGTVDCRNCDLRRNHVLAWPEEALYQIEFRRNTLWALCESAIVIRDFIASSDWNRAAFKWRSLLLHIPKVFLTARAREGIVKRLNRLL